MIWYPISGIDILSLIGDVNSIKDETKDIKRDKPNL